MMRRPAGGRATPKRSFRSASSHVRRNDIALRPAGSRARAFSARGAFRPHLGHDRDRRDARARICGVTRGGASLRQRKPQQQKRRLRPPASPHILAYFRPIATDEIVTAYMRDFDLLGQCRPVIDPIKPTRRFAGHCFNKIFPAVRFHKPPGGRLDHDAGPGRRPRRPLAVAMFTCAEPTP